MDSYDFRKIDRELELRGSNDAFDWNPRMTAESQPPKIELVPIGEYDGEDLLPDCHILDDSYVVYLEVVQ